jgi:hypothetical protein
MELQSQLQIKHQMDGDTALRIIEAASNRVVHAMESGELHLTIRKDTDFSSVLFRCINDEVDRRAGRNAARVPVSQTQTVDVMPFTALLSAAPDMEDEVRVAASLHGLLGLAAVTTSKILDKSLLDTEHLLDEGRHLLKRATTVQ